MGSIGNSIVPVQVQYECEGGAFSRAVAVDGECSAKLLGGKGAAMQSKSMAVLAGREPVRKNPGQVLFGDADPVVDHGDVEPAAGGRGADGQPLVGMRRSLAGLLCVADQIDEDLQNLVAVTLISGRRVSNSFASLIPWRSKPGSVSLNTSSINSVTFTIVFMPATVA